MALDRDVVRTMHTTRDSTRGACLAARIGNSCMYFARNKADDEERVESLSQLLSSLSSAGQPQSVV